VPEVRGILPGHGDARDAKGCFEIVGGHASVAHAGAEGDGAHGVRVPHVPANSPRNVAYPDTIRSVDVLELARRVPAALPGTPNVRTVIYSEVVERD